MKFILFLFFNILMSINSYATELNFNEFSLIPIIHEGRVKPLGTFARIKLTEFYGKSKLEKMSDSEWLAELFFNPKKSYERDIFKIVNNDVKNALFLSKEKKYFNFIEIYKAFSQNQKLIGDILSKDDKELDLTGIQIKDLYNKFSDYMAISRSFSFFSPDLKVSPNLFLSYYDLLKFDSKTLNAKAVTSFKDYIKEDSQFNALLIVPNKLKGEIEWATPWSALLGHQEELLIKWHDLYKSYISNKSNFSNNAILLQDKNLLSKFKAELFLSKYDLDTYSLAFYIFGFLVLSVFFLLQKKIFYQLSLMSLVVGILFHAFFISTRCFILTRPPVTNLYESILFVGLTCVFISLWYELKRKNSLGLFIGSILGSVMLFLSFGYQKSGDNLSMVVAVLDTNFWLATHVLTISIGYGCALVSSLLAHFYLFKFKQSNEPDNKTLEKNLHGAVLFSLFFTTLGTILGGIWADQSWGRFWGWDPKENGALLICLWLLWITHAKLAGKFKNLSFAFFSALTSIIVIMAWFGVNLLNVGLHSYGFSSDAARSIIIFSILEVIIASSLFYKAKRAHNS